MGNTIKHRTIQGDVTIAQGHFYKYKSLAGRGLKQTREIVRDSRIFFPRPSQLNDPRECKPTMVIGDISDEKYWPAVEAWVRRCVAGNVPPPSEEQIQAQLAQLTQPLLYDMMRQSEIEFRVAVDRHYMILSLADSAHNNHLWKDYAGDFSGVCMQFLVNARFGTCYRVRYCDDDRMIDLTSIEDMEHLVQTVLVKRSLWKRENEYRLVFGDPPIDDQAPLVQQKYEFGPEHLFKLIVGCRAKPRHRGQLLALARSRQPRLRCYEAMPPLRRRRPTHGSVRLRPLSIWIRPTK